MGEMVNAYKILVGEPEEKRALGRTRRRWEDIQMDLMEIRLEGINWIHLAPNMALVNTIINLRVS
jgi:hypothetical protein